MTTSIGFIGLGTMGYAMAANLLNKGFDVTVYNRTAAKAEQLRELGAAVAASPADAARGRSVVITMVSNDDSIRDVYDGEQGIFSAVSEGTVIVDSSTISPDLARRLAVDATSRGAIFLDAPVTGSKPAAEAGMLVFMVGGSAETALAIEPVLLAMGRKVIPMGPSGSGAVAKLAHNTVVGINTAALMEGFAIAAKGGIEGSSFLELIQSGGAASRAAELKGGKLLEQDYSVQFALELMLKDLRLSSVLSDKLGVPTPLLEASKSLYQVGDAAGYGQLDLSAVAKVYEQWIGRAIGEKKQ
ncbi:3-hydroxyisobutyrate dehydrogenase [Paenibacillus cellulosilyticus]|uniref:3-hydroxyisobutyrate dehydrogenase n=1 Tax=Paenibacillus cellulosilyticus TaxID=375489 RepID=A0A2V2YVJ0_9BACL|nr:NAD(P)-dependent oxidoreductase [Paenibacillus cellulosilyticus]PWW02480.1 3-hydroxyisobutyrate dehydrogenase [Paenibacillus cellulosilyticus]QKS47186.1 NAD(P)-dependent oxidoreductase [Paenibacillus cellulosilyticus]